MRELRSFVGGEYRDGSVVPDINPADPANPVANVHMADESVAREAVSSARSAFPAWSALPAPDRGTVLRKAADLLEMRAEVVGRDLTTEEGKTIGEAIGEVRRAVAILRYFAGQTLEPDGETYPSHTSHTLLYARREPVGVVVVITPWNFPIAIPAWKIAPALAYGNTVVWKPAELVPLTSMHFLDVLLEAGLPSSVMNLVLGKGSVVGNALTTNSSVDAITFTGSNPVGSAIQKAAVERGIKVQLEMGGKNPAIVLADADLDVAAEQVARGAFLSAGQKCTATSRVIVNRDVFDDFADRLSDLAGKWKVGDPLDASTRVGPVVSEAQLDTVRGYIELGKEEGGQVLVGGRRAAHAGGGYYMEPTLLVGLGGDSRVSREEIFGPVATLLPATDYEEAIAMANDTQFGLSASLFTRDLTHALRFIREIRAGVVKVNQESAGLEFQVPFGGMKSSSTGSREQGKVARDFFTQWKTVYMDPSPE